MEYHNLQDLYGHMRCMLTCQHFPTIKQTSGALATNVVMFKSKRWQQIKKKSSRIVGIKFTSESCYHNAIQLSEIIYASIGALLKNW